MSSTAMCTWEESVNDVPGMLRRTFHRLLNESVERPWHRQLASFLGNRIERAGLFGITLDLRLTDDDLAALARDFVPSMRSLLNPDPATRLRFGRFASERRPGGPS